MLHANAPFQVPRHILQIRIKSCYLPCRSCFPWNTSVGTLWMSLIALVHSYWCTHYCSHRCCEGMYFILCDTCLYITNSYVTLVCTLLIVKQSTVYLKRYVSEVGQLCPHLTKNFGKLDNQFPKSLDDQLRKENPVTFLRFAPKRNY